MNKFNLSIYQNNPLWLVLLSRCYILFLLIPIIGLARYIYYKSNSIDNLDFLGIVFVSISVVIFILFLIFLLFNIFKVNVICKIEFYPLGLIRVTLEKFNLFKYSTIINKYNFSYKLFPNGMLEIINENKVVGTISMKEIKKNTDVNWDELINALKKFKE